MPDATVVRRVVVAILSFTARSTTGRLAACSTYNVLAQLLVEQKMMCILPEPSTVGSGMKTLWLSFRLGTTVLALFSYVDRQFLGALAMTRLTGGLIGAYLKVER